LVLKGSESNNRKKKIMEIIEPLVTSSISIISSTTEAVE